jgi:hypothetical protein
VASLSVDLRYQQPILRSRAQKARDPCRRDSNKREIVSQTRNAALKHKAILLPLLLTGASATGLIQANIKFLKNC